MSEKLSIPSIYQLIEQGKVWPASQYSLAANIPYPDSPLHFLQRGNLHQWTCSIDELIKHRIWVPPLYVLTHFIFKLLAQHIQSAEIAPSIFWIGRKLWPSPYLLGQAQLTFQIPLSRWQWDKNCFFLDLRHPQERLLATCYTLRNQNVFAVVCDGTNFNFKDSRKLQLAVKTGKELGIIVKSPAQFLLPTIASTKWEVSPKINNEEIFAWKITLSKAPGLTAPLMWQLISNYYEENSFHIRPLVTSRHEEEKSAEKQQASA
ncbi:MAG: hypothetical protein IT292_12000 [Deltaproteobacteria bacterium]|nr:hypothetical protein [Deltaproteobacteria bacterium]